MATYKLYKRKTKQGYRYWYWYIGEDGKRRWKSTGCRTRDDAEQEIKKLERSGNPENVTLREYAGNFFIWGTCKWIRRQREKGKSFSEDMAAVRRGHLRKHLFPKFGDMPLQRLNPVMLEEWLLTLDLANHTRNQLMYTLRMIVREAVRAGVLHHDPLAGVERFSTRDYTKRDILTGEDIEKLFPVDPEAFRKVWPQFFNGVMFATALSAGLRSGELRALQWCDMAWELSGILVQRALSIKQVIGPPKGKEYRAVPVPARTLDLLRTWYEETKYDAINSFCFPDADGNPITRFVTLDRFRNGLKRAKVDTADRQIVVHSLRHTFNTRMRQRLTDADLRLLTGHKDERMTEHYDHAKLIDRLEKLQPQRIAIDSFWQN